MKKILNLIVISFISLTALHAQFLVEGVVQDETGSSLPGVSIIEKGTTNGTTSDVDGKYTLTVTNEQTILVFSFVGMITVEIQINGQSKITAILKADATNLEEVVVIGYGVQRKSVCTGSVQSITPGVRTNRMNKRTRKKKSQPNILIRGSSTIYGSQINNKESYSKPTENGFKQVMNAPLSTFSIDVDRASYSNVRRFINNGQKPPTDAIRVEEMINYFKYDYPKPDGEHPIAIHTEVSSCPWNSEHLLMQVGMQAKEISKEELPASNLVFLIDVSGSMSSFNKLPLLKQSMKMLVDKLRDDDKVAIVVYAGAAGLVLPSTKAKHKEKIIEAIDNLHAGGSTAGGAGIKLAYSVAEKHFIKDGNNRVILATDGDFNVGASSDRDMEELITDKRETGIYLTCLGYGMGNYKDSKLETLADKGNGNYAYIDNIQEAEKTLVEEFGGTLFTIAKDVKIQIEFNPGFVEAYRLVGYENRLLNDEDFKDDTKDAGEIGSGHTVTALYEIIPKGSESKFLKDIDELKYQNKLSNDSQEIANVKVRYKLPDQKKSIPFEQGVLLTKKDLNETSENFRFAASVALFGLLLSESGYVEDVNYADVINIADVSRTFDKDGYKAEFVRLVKSARNY